MTAPGDPLAPLWQLAARLLDGLAAIVQRGARANLREVRALEALVRRLLLVRALRDWCPAPPAAPRASRPGAKPDRQARFRLIEPVALALHWERPAPRLFQPPALAGRGRPPADIATRLEALAAVLNAPGPRIAALRRWMSRRADPAHAPRAPRHRTPAGEVLIWPAPLSPFLRLGGKGAVFEALAAANPHAWQAWHGRPRASPPAPPARPCPADRPSAAARGATSACAAVSGGRGRPARASPPWR